jgi:GTP-binding protein EngB required for normal cell division
MDSAAHTPRESLNEFQANRLRITCQYIDKLLGEIEGILNTAGSKSAFPRYSADIAPAQRRTVEDYIARVRAQLIRVLEGQGIRREEPSIPASRAVHVTLSAIDIAAEELKPKYMRGYGDIPEIVALELNGIAGELSSLVSRLDRYLSQGLGQDLKARLDHLERAGNGLRILETIEQIVRDRGLVEFRSAIAAVLDRAEDSSFEIAVVGRVSSGKSSLLNAILSTDVLPVGVTPITTVPTRIIHADEPSLTVRFSEAPTNRLDIARLPEFATEQHNPGNMKHITRLIVALPSPRLRDGVAFVDTPGLGSIATSGAAETLAYLPKCDMGIVLIDAGSTFTPDDLQTILTLQEAAIPINVLLSKADVLSPPDLARIVQYVKEHIASECKLDLVVRPVSVLPAYREMLDEWFENEILPLYSRSQELRAASLRRKIGALRESVASALGARLKLSQQSVVKSKGQVHAAEALLRRATGQIENMSSYLQKAVESAAAKAPKSIGESSRRLLHSWSVGIYGVVVPGQLVRDSITQFVQLEIRSLQGEMIEFAGQLGRDLRQCATNLGLPDAPSDDEFQSIIRGTPVFELPSVTIDVSRPVLAGIVGRWVVERRIARQISRCLGPSFHSAFESYWRLVEDWGELIISQLRQLFETYAENYRAQAEQALGGRFFTDEELRAVQDDLAQLRLETAADGVARNPEKPDGLSAADTRTRTA